jgi:prevent-host-death family protein
MKDVVNIFEAKAHLSRYLAQVEKSGRRIVICRNNKPIADLVPHRSVQDPLQADPELAGARYVGDPCAPLSDEDWPEALR